MDFVDGVRVFVAAVQTGSFAGAAARLGISNKLASKYLAQLEDRLGTRLLQRTTRKLGMTPAGERFMARAPGWLEDLDEMASDIREEREGITGLIRVSAPLTVGELHVQDMLRRFAKPHPGVGIDLRLSDRYVDLAADGIDLAIRIGRLDAASLVARKLGETELLAVASPEYLHSAGEPATAEDLLAHDCIRDTNMRGGPGWPLGEGGGLAVTGRFMVNSARAARDLAVAAEGIALCPDYVVREDLESGRLRHLLVDLRGPKLPINAVYLQGRRPPRRLRALIEFAVQDWAKARGTR